jgi:hypothetical protein
MASGKSLVATYLVEHHGFTELCFAKKMKEVCAELFPHAKYDKDRWLLIQVGELLRELDANVWIRFVLQDIKPDANIVISDVRLPKEYWALRRLNFAMVRMYVSRQSQLAYIAKAYPDMPLVLLDDYTETALDNYPFDFCIDNDLAVPLEEVYKQVDIMLEEIKIGRY